MKNTKNNPTTTKLPVTIDASAVETTRLELIRRCREAQQCRAESALAEIESLERHLADLKRDLTTVKEMGGQVYATWLETRSATIIEDCKGTLQAKDSLSESLRALDVLMMVANRPAPELNADWSTIREMLLDAGATEKLTTDGRVATLSRNGKSATRWADGSFTLTKTDDSNGHVWSRKDVRTGNEILKAML